MTFSVQKFINFIVWHNLGVFYRNIVYDYVLQLHYTELIFAARQRLET